MKANVTPTIIIILKIFKNTFSPYEKKIVVGDLHHPFHLHGYRFMVIGLYRNTTGLPMTLNKARSLDRSGNLKRLTGPRPPFKDTVSIPNRGYAVIRFRATNPGNYYNI